ncbi:MAG TPA: hypothetical protein VG222_15675, partial [Vicinamibacterales bacterium]|nr:hypothetical protein [Vicinamibacterales bacterium]
NGFVGEFLILLGAFRADPMLATFATTGVILSATYMLWMFQRVNYGTVTNEKNATLKDLAPREWAVLLPVLALVIVMGVLPNVFLRPIGPSVERMLNQIHVVAPARVRAGVGIRDSGLGIRDSGLASRAPRFPPGSSGPAESLTANPKSQIPNPGVSQ